MALSTEVNSVGWRNARRGCSEAGVAVTAQEGGDSLLTRVNSLATAFSRARIQDQEAIA